MQLNLLLYLAFVLDKPAGVRWRRRRCARRETWIGNSAISNERGNGMRTMLTRVAMLHTPREVTMKGPPSRLQLTLIVAILVVCSLGAQVPAWAQGLDEWSFVLTPQVWVSHISSNGLVGPAA